MARALRTGRKSIPIHPVRVIHTKPQPSSTHEEPRRRKPRLSQDEYVKKVLRQLTTAAYNEDALDVARLEAKLDRLLQ